MAYQQASSAAINKWIQGMEKGREIDKDRLIDYVNSNYEEANSRLSTLRDSQLEFFSPTVKAQQFLDAFDLGEYISYSAQDVDEVELKAAARTMQRFLASPTSIKKNAAKLAKNRMEYAFDPEGKIRLNDLIPNATQRQKNYVARIFSDYSLFSQVIDLYGTTGEIAEELAGDYSYNETYSENINKLRVKVAKEIEERDLYMHTPSPTLNLHSK